MTLDEFMSTTTARLPSANELIDLCHTLEMRLVMADGKPVIRTSTKDRDVGILIARLLKREPWRTQALKVVYVEHKPEADKPECDREILWANGHTQDYCFPENGWPTGSRAWRNKGETAWTRIPGVEWGPLPIPDGVTFA